MRARAASKATITGARIVSIATFGPPFCGGAAAVPPIVVDIEARVAYRVPHW